MNAEIIISIQSPLAMACIHAGKLQIIHLDFQYGNKLSDKLINFIEILLLGMQLKIIALRPALKGNYFDDFAQFRRISANMISTFNSGLLYKNFCH